MKVKELYEFLGRHLEDGSISPDTAIIITGEYNYGQSLGRPHIESMNLIDGRDIIKEDTRVVAIDANAYLFECEDLGYSRMWVDNQELQDLIENDMLNCGDKEHES